MDYPLRYFYNLIGIEANDVSALFEQFLEYEEKQGIIVCHDLLWLNSSHDHIHYNSTHCGSTYVPH